MVYLAHTLFLDVTIAINIFAINNLVVRHYNRSLFNSHKGNKMVVGALLIFDVLIVLLVYYLDLLLQSAVILLVEASLAGLIAATVWFVMIIKLRVK